ncbi:MAG: dihydrodipicolinate reductase [Bryobacteraceae bacterium]|nr:dihydrodipicolinate reductase [Bryobacteraceae bacterium]
MKLAIVGYGKMGRIIEQLAPEYGFETALQLDIHNNANYEGMTEENFEGIDVAVEFSTPDTVVENLTRLAILKVNTVAGTTGWTAHLDYVKAAVEEHGSGLVWAPNFSVGVNVFTRLAAEAARLLSRHEDYGAWAWEIHHDAKKDAPSGTLLKLVESMTQAGYHRPISVAANRAGKVPGIHEIGFDSAADTITLRHVARNREGFARGALEAARWIAGRKGFYEFRQILFGEVT